MYTISYIIATKNRLNFLRIIFDRLLPQLRPDEEIVVVDGNSTDGAKEYLQNLLSEGKIHQLISENDRNQAHAWNKGMLAARGMVIKKIIDDDVHDYNVIRKCRDFMLVNPGIDICISNSLESSLYNPEKIGLTGSYADFLRWKAGEIPSFYFGDVYLLIRKSSLSYIGLYDTQFTMIDWEYALRMSYLKVNIAFYTGCNSLSVFTPGNVSSWVSKETLKKEGAIGKLKYGYIGHTISLFSKFKIRVGTTLFRNSMKKRQSHVPHPQELTRLYEVYYQTLQDHNQQGDWEFLTA